MSILYFFGLWCILGYTVMFLATVFPSLGKIADVFGSSVMKVEWYGRKVGKKLREMRK